MAVLFKKYDEYLRKIRFIQLVVYLIAPYLWMCFMFYLPHKEERFLFVIYPLICLSAALSIILLVHLLVSIVTALVSHHIMIMKFLIYFIKQGSGESTRTFVKRIFIVVIIVIFVTLSASRAVSLTKNYGNAAEVYKHLSSNELHNQVLPESKIVNVCVGKEWYRFPSNFFLPSEQFQLRFLKSGFGGQLPKPFAKVNGTSQIPTGFNNLNKEEIDRYVCITIFMRSLYIFLIIFLSIRLIFLIVII